MGNPYYNMMNNQAFGAMNNMVQMVNEARVFMQNPMQYVVQHRLNLPQGALQNPYGTIQSMLNNGQMSQAQLNQNVAAAQQILSMIGRR